MEQRWAKLYKCSFVGVVEKDSRHCPADFGKEKARAPADLEHLLDEVEFIEYRRRDFEVRAMVAELMRRGGCSGSAGGAPKAAWQLTKTYAAFLSHFKLESAGDARHIKDKLEIQLGAPVFLDSD